MHVTDRELDFFVCSRVKRDGSESYTDSGVEVNCSMCKDGTGGKETVGAER
jgi:hypothetical protein